MTSRVLLQGVVVLSVLLAAVVSALTMDVDGQPSTRPGAAAVQPPPSGDGATTSDDPAWSTGPEAFGAVGDGVTDDTEALQRALDALSPGQELRLREGRTYLHADVLRVETPGVRLTGPGTLLATDEERSALQVTSPGAVVRDLVLEIAGTTQRWSTPDQHRLVVSGDGVVVQSVQVRGSAAAGIFVDGATGFRLEDVQVADTRADGIHVTGGASNGVLLRPVTSGTGDDGVGLVSYGEQLNSGITVVSPRVLGTTGGRGVSVVGGVGIELRDVRVEGSAAAGLLVVTEGEPWNSAGVDGVRVLGAELVRTNQDAAIDHGAVLLQAGRGGSVVRDVVLEDVVIIDTRPGASRQVGVLAGEGRMERVQLQRVTITGGGPAVEVQVGDDARVQDVTVDGEPWQDGAT